MIPNRERPGYGSGAGLPLTIASAYLWVVMTERNRCVSAH
jgi:hypothetical protein